MKILPSSVQGQIVTAFSACFLFMALLIASHFRMLYLVVGVLLLGFVVFFVGGKIVRPLTRVSRVSNKINQEVFSGSISPSGELNNEICSLMTALNRMVTELKQRQELLVQAHRNTVISTLIPGIIHQINNPINNIVLTLETLIEDNQTIEPEERLILYQEALEQADRVGDLVNNLLEFSRTAPSRVEEVKIEELIDKTIRLLNNEFKRHRIKIYQEIDGSFPTLYLDGGELQLVLVNLLLNSVQSMPDGGQLRIILSRIENEVQIDIIDTGWGIPSENLSMIFNPFFTTKKGGTGLGLSIVHDILQKQGGRIKVQSIEGQGSTFSLMIPLLEV